MKTVLVSLTYLIGIGELFLAMYFWATNSKNEIRRVMAALALTTGTWVILGALLAYHIPSNVTTYYLAGTYTLGVFVVTLVFHLAVLYPNLVFRFDFFHRILLYVPALIFSFASLTSSAIVSGFSSSSQEVGTVAGGPAYVVYNLYLTLLFLASLGIIRYKIGRSDGINRKNLKLVLVSIFLGGLPSVLIDLVFPLLGIQVNYLLGVISTLFWLGFTSYIILKK